MGWWGRTVLFVALVCLHRNISSHDHGRGNRPSAIPHSDSSSKTKATAPVSEMSVSAKYHTLSQTPFETKPSDRIPPASNQRHTLSETTLKTKPPDRVTPVSAKRHGLSQTHSETKPSDKNPPASNKPDTLSETILKTTSPGMVTPVSDNYQKSFGTNLDTKSSDMVIPVSKNHQKLFGTFLETEPSDKVTSQIPQADVRGAENDSVSRNMTDAKQTKSASDLWQYWTGRHSGSPGKCLVPSDPKSHKDIPSVDYGYLLNQILKRKTSEEEDRDSFRHVIKKLVTRLPNGPPNAVGRTEDLNPQNYPPWKRKPDTMHFMRVDEYCRREFYFSSDLNSTKVECSLLRVLEEDPRADTFPIVTLTTADTENCSPHQVWDTMYVHNVIHGNITFRSDDVRFMNGSLDNSFTLCVRLQTPNFTFAEFWIQNRENWMKTSKKVEIEVQSLYGKQHRHMKGMASGRAVRSEDNDMLLKVSHLHELFQHAQSLMTLTLMFKVVPDCVKEHLEVNCFNPHADRVGIIQTPHWNGLRKYRPNMNTCLTLELQRVHVIMVSSVMLDVEPCTACLCDFMEIYLTSDCSEKPISTSCSSQDLNPSRHQSDVMSIRFKSDNTDENSGFRILYSYHQLSHPPVQLSNGKWVCSGRPGHILIEHFICSIDILCDGSEDRLRSSCPPKLCGPSSVLIDGRCYWYIRKSRYITWDDAMNSCEANQGYLISLNTEREWSKVLDFWSIITGHKYLMVGLSQGSNRKDTELYSSMWTWADGTIAYYLNISQTSGISPPYCTAFLGNNPQLTVHTCHTPIKAHYLCELYSQDTDPSLRTPVSVPVPSKNASALEGMAECLNKEVTHNFLQCDMLTKCHAKTWTEVSECAQNKPFMSDTMFTCNDQRLVHYSVVCDFFGDCDDFSDERFCIFPHCHREQYYCGRRQCISLDQRCDGVYDCIDGNDEFRCQTSEKSNVSNTVPPPALIDFKGPDQISVKPLNISRNIPTCPETHFQCPNEGYCLPVYVRCNKVRDCAGGEDEADCHSYTCPGLYKCRDAGNCVHADHLCDGIFQCKGHDDELMCHMTCPYNCVCLGFAFVCYSRISAEFYPQLRYLKANDTDTTLQDVATNQQLVYLNLRHCNIKSIDGWSLPNVQTLDLSYNGITSITGKDLNKMYNLRTLSLAFNSLLSLDTVDYSTLRFYDLSVLDLSGVHVHEITNTTLLPFRQTHHLNLSGSGLQIVRESGFSKLHQLQVLDVRECPVSEFSVDLFNGLTKLHTIYANNFKLCCPNLLPENFLLENCHAPSDEVSSCDNLLRYDIFRVFLSIYAFFALVGNSVSFVYRVFSKKVTMRFGFDVFVTHLCLSDFLMGVYLAIIGIADRLYYGNYEWKDKQWKQSAACQIAGFLSLLSSEVSAFLICFITLERFLLIRFPHKNLRFNTKSAWVACVMSWMVGVILAAVPLFPFSPPWDFYSQTGICIPLPIARNVFVGRRYAFLVIIVFNFILFLLIAAGQFLIFWSIRSQSKVRSRSSKKSKDMAIARRLLAVAMSNFMCWFPIGLLGLLAKNGMPIPGSVIVGMAIFVLPFNSALDPFLYTLHILLEKRRAAQTQSETSDKSNPVSTTRPHCSRREQLMNMDASSLTETTQWQNGQQDVNTDLQDVYTAQEAWQLFEKFLEDGLVTPERAQIHITKLINKNSEAEGHNVQD